MDCRYAPRRVRILIAATVVAATLTAPAAARTPKPIERVDAFLTFFDQLALKQQDTFGWRPKWVRRWDGPVAVRLGGLGTAKLRPKLAAMLRDLSQWTGVSFRLDPPGAYARRILISVKPHSYFENRYGARKLVCTAATYGRRGRLRRSYVEISAKFTDCLAHELMHALGFDGHWFGRPGGMAMRSVMAHRYSSLRAPYFSKWDQMAIRLLYHERLRPGMARTTVLPMARSLTEPGPTL